jgi:hypothetical protein
MTTTATAPVFRIIAEPPNHGHRRACIVCGDDIEKFEVAGKIDNGAPRQDVCNDCLDAGAEGITARLIEHAERLELWAALMRSAADATWELPTAEDRAAAVAEQAARDKARAAEDAER